MASWPGTLPGFDKMLADGYEAVMVDNIIATEMDVGPPKIRRRSSAGVEPISGSMRMTATQLATFKTFYNTTINYGADEFDATHPETGGACTMIFMGQPTRRAAGIDWIVSFMIGVLP